MGVFRISVILPVLNEAAGLAAVLARVRAGAPLETVVVDGGSEDASVEIARREKALVLSAGRGRARQMNAGAARARGDVLLFLHGDTLLPAGWSGEVRRLLSDPATVAGAFSLGIDGDERGLRWIERAANLRSRRWGLPYGDQALFVRAETFRRLTGYPEIPVMEDFALVRRLRTMGSIGISRLPVLTSPRRWRSDGLWRTTARNWLAVAGWSVGVSPQRIAGWTRRAQSGRPSRSGPTATVGGERVGS